MTNILERINRKIRWEFRLILSWIHSFSFASVGAHLYLGKDCIIIGAKYIHVGNNFVAHDRNRIEAIDRNGPEQFKPKIHIGNNVSMGYDCHIGAINNVQIGSNVLLASKIYISDHDHGATTFDEMMLPPVQRRVLSKGAVIIKDNVWIGEGVVILANVTIGECSIIAANAVVTKDIPAFSVAAGVPAKVIKIVKPQVEAH
jgi:acetyltransferase-like isoleucine patch superfamily enzyme